MKMQLCLNGTRQEILAQIDEARLVFATSLEAQPPAGAAKDKAGKSSTPAAGKNAKKEEPAAEQSEGEGSGQTEAENTASADAADNDDLGFDEPPPAKEKKKLKIEDVQIAFRDFAKAKDGNRDKAKKVLEKFKVKSVLDLKPEDFEKAIAALK